jgi:hypothetical protein
MFRLIKLAVYAIAGYALWEIYQGLTSDAAGGGRARRGGSRQLRRALDTDSGRMQTLTGPGVGQEEETVDSRGGSASHRVGRGVTSS